MLDNMTANERGQVISLEDTGNNAYVARVYQYDPRNGDLARIAEHDRGRIARIHHPGRGGRPGSSRLRSSGRGSTSSMSRTISRVATPSSSKVDSCWCYKSRRVRPLTGDPSLAGEVEQRVGVPAKEIEAVKYGPAPNPRMVDVGRFSDSGGWLPSPILGS
jgi:hypothetical protein